MPSACEQDGRQAMTGSIGLPEFFMDESKWQLILLVYFGGMIFGMPIMVWRWCVHTHYPKRQSHA